MFYQKIKLIKNCSLLEYNLIEMKGHQVHHPIKVYVSLCASNDKSVRIKDVIANAFADVVEDAFADATPSRAKRRDDRLESIDQIAAKIAECDVVLVIFDSDYRQHIDANTATIGLEYQKIIESGKWIVPIVRSNHDHKFFPDTLEYHDCYSSASKAFLAFLDSLKDGTWKPKTPKRFKPKVKLTEEEKELFKAERNQTRDERNQKRDEYRKKRQETQRKRREEQQQEKTRLLELESTLNRMQTEHAIEMANQERLKHQRDYMQQELQASKDKVRELHEFKTKALTDLQELEKQAESVERVQRLLDQQKAEMDHLEKQRDVLKNKIAEANLELLDDDDSMRIECCICLERAKNTVLVPCGHQCACYECAIQTDKCPICRHSIQRVQKIFIC